MPKLTKEKFIRRLGEHLLTPETIRRIKDLPASDLNIVSIKVSKLVSDRRHRHPSYTPRIDTVLNEVLNKHLNKIISKRTSRKIASLPPGIHEKVTAIRGHLGYPSDSAVAHAGIILLYQKTFPSYLGKSGTQSLESHADSKARRSDSSRQQKKDDARDFQVAILDSLGGRIEERESGEVGIYYNYNFQSRLEQEVPLDMLTEGLIEGQYSPSRTKVEKLRAEGKCDYDLNE